MPIQAVLVGTMPLSKGVAVGEQWAVVVAAVIGAAGGAAAALVALRGTTRSARLGAEAQHDLWVRQTRQSAYPPVLLDFWDAYGVQRNVVGLLQQRCTVRMIEHAVRRIEPPLNALPRALGVFVTHGSTVVASAAGAARSALRDTHVGLESGVHCRVWERGSEETGAWIRQAVNDVAEAERAVRHLLHVAHAEMEGTHHYGPPLAALPAPPGELV